MTQAPRWMGNAGEHGFDTGAIRGCCPLLQFHHHLLCELFDVAKPGGNGGGQDDLAKDLVREYAHRARDDFVI